MSAKVLLRFNTSASSVVQFKVRTLQFGHKIVKEFHLVNARPFICVVSAIRVHWLQVEID